MAGDVKRFAVKAKQYDRATRVIVVSLLWDEVPYVLDSEDTVRCNVHKPDGTIAIVEGDNIAVSGNTVTITLPGTALTAAGRAWADIEIETQDESQQVSCQCFEIDIAKSPVDDDSIISTNEFSAMKLATKAANDAAAAATAEIEATAAAGTAASQAAAAAQAATEAANQAAAAATASIQIDTTLTDNSKAAPAGMVGQIKEDLSTLKDYNAYDIFRDAPYSYENKTQYGVTWQWDAQNKVCTVSGTATQMSRNRFFVDTTSLHSSIVPGKTYYIKYHSTGTAPALYVAWYTNGNMISYKYYRANAEVEVPSDATGCIIGLQITAGGSVDGTVSVQMLTAEPNDVLSETVNTISEQLSDDKKFYGIDFAPMYFDFSTVTHNGVSFTWDAIKRTCKVSGTTTPDAANDILCSGKLPEGMNEGDKFLIRFKLDKIQSIAVRVYFYDSNGNILLDKYSSLHKIGNASADIPFEVPAGSATWRIKVYVPYRASDPITVDATVTRLQLFKTTPRKMEVPLIVSFIDDDTTNDTYVTRYHDSCCHNGITGNYAVITDRIGDTTSLAKLLQYEDEGFGMLIHAKDQNPSRTPYWSPKDEQGNPRAHTTEEINLCRANLCAGLRKMREDGFVNINYWVTPGGHHEDEIIEMAKQLGLECMIPTNNFRYNSMQDCTKWIIRRISLDNTTQSGAAENLQFVKDKIDEAVAAGGGWLIITTHYNEGWSSTDTWDDTLDSNGYPVGYDRFNEIAQYAILSGMVPMTIPQAWEYYRIIIEANHSEYQRTIT